MARPIIPAVQNAPTRGVFRRTHRTPPGDKMEADETSRRFCHAHLRVPVHRLRQRLRADAPGVAVERPGVVPEVWQGRGEAGQRLRLEGGLHGQRPDEGRVPGAGREGDHEVGRLHPDPSPTGEGLASKWLVALVVLSAISLFGYLRFRGVAFPEHAIRFAVGREAAADEAARFARERLGVDPAAYRQVTVFRVDDQARTFLEKEVGVGRTAELAGQVDLWHFTTRYFRPLEKEELQVAVGPDGALRGFRHTLDETAPGARLGRDEALRRAEALRDELAPAGQWRLVEERSEEHPSRLDWRFTWERTDLRVAPSAPEAADEARARVEVVVQGDQPGELRQLLKVPEAWTRRYEAIRSANNLAETIDLVAGTLPLGLALLWVLVRRWARGDVRWRPALWLGGVGGVLAGAGLLNELPRMVASYPTSTPWEGFVAQTVLLAVLGGLGQGLLIGLAAAAGEPLYRAAFPRLLALAPGFTWRGALTRPGATALVVGA